MISSTTRRSSSSSSSSSHNNVQGSRIIARLLLVLFVGVAALVLPLWISTDTASSLIINPIIESSSLLSTTPSSSRFLSDSNDDNSGSDATTAGGDSGSDWGWDRSNPLRIPRGGSPSMPSLRIEDSELDKQRKIYGGAGDKVHLGGFTDIDLDGISPSVWKHMIQSYGIQSVLDVGCGRGISTSWFLTHGVDTLCVEGSHDAIERTMVPDPASQIVEHDFSRGPWWPEQTYDAAWVVEFLEHVSLHHQFNYLTALRKTALIFATSSRWGGWHHVEVHYDDWWIRKFQAYGFQYDAQLTEEVRRIATIEGRQKIPAFNNRTYFGYHILGTMKVFVNPIVAALPQHAHLFPEIGCYDGKNKTTKKMIHRECATGKFGGNESPLHPEYFPLNITKQMDEEWVNLVNRHLSTKMNN